MTLVLIYQMARVGSMGLFHTLKESVPVLHFHHLQPHLLGNDRAKEAHVLETGIDGNKPGSDPKNLMPIRQQLLSGEMPFFIICPIREPIGRELSYFYIDLISDRLPYASLSDPVDKLINDFATKFPHDTYSEWFKYEMEAHTGIDVFAHPFPKELGWQVYTNGPIKLLLFKIELGNDHIAQLVREFLGLQTYKFTEFNVGEGLHHGSLYKALKSKKLPEAFLNKMCESRYFKYFYSDLFIQQTKRKWSQTAAL